MNTVNIGPIVDRIRDAVRFANSVDQLTWGRTGDELWNGVYPELTRDLPGLVGSLTARCEANAVRLAVLFALLDESDRIESCHLKPALAVVDHCIASVKYIFRDSTGNPLANRIYAIVNDSGKGGLSRTELHRRLGGHEDGRLIDDAVTSLERLCRVTTEKKPGKGRPAQCIRLA